MRTAQKWCLSPPLSLKGVLTGFCSSGRCFTISKWIFSYTLGAFQTAPFVLASRVSESLCEPFISEFSVPYNSCGLLGYNPHWFQMTFWGLLSGGGLKCWGAWCGSQMPRFSERNSVRSFLIVFCHAHGRSFEETAKPSGLDVALLSFVGKELFSQFWIFFRGDFICRCIFFVSVGGGEFQSSHTAILNHLQCCF